MIPFILLLIILPLHQPQSRWSVRHSVPFRVHVAQGVSEENVQRVLQELDRAHTFCKSEWELPFPSRVSVYIYHSSSEFRRRTRQRWYRAAYWDGYALHVPNPRVLVARKQLASTITHEATHIALQRIWRNRLPGWFEEGFAVYNSGEMPLLPQPRRSCASLKALMDERSRIKSVKEEREWYATTGALVFILIRQFGKGSIKRLLAETTGTSFKKSVRTVLKIPVAQFEKDLLDEFNFRVRTGKFPY